MLVHSVMWKISDGARGLSKADNIRDARVALSALKDRIPEIQGLSVGVQAWDDPDAWDIVLHAVFMDRDGLVAYQNHPDHLEAARLIAQVRTERAVVDYLV